MAKRESDPKRSSPAAPSSGSRPSSGGPPGASSTGIVGRELELARLEAWAAEAMPGPLVITGAGGIGKTALLRAFLGAREGAAIVDCGHCSSVEEVGIALAAVLDLDATAARGPHVLARTAKKRGVRILAFDNVEQLSSSAKELEVFMSIVPHTLATSRIALGFARESSLVVPPLPTGGPDAAGALLLRSKSGLDSGGGALAPEDASLVTKISVLVDGVPLALELAATQVATFGLAWTADRLARGSLALGSGAEPAGRGSSLDATFRSSWECLSDRQRAAVAQLSSFSGLFSLGEAARALGEDLADVASLVGTLTRHSWISVEAPSSRFRIASPSDEPRFRMLVPLREFARRRLEELPDPTERARARERHEDVVLSVTGEAIELLRTERARETVQRIGRFYPDLLEIVGTGSANTSPERVARATEIAGRWALDTGALSSFAQAASMPGVEAAVGAAPRSARLRAWLAWARVDWRGGRLREARARAELALESAETDDEAAACLAVVGHTCAHGGDVEGAYQLAMEARERCTDPAVACEIALTIAGTSRWLGFTEEARLAAAEGVTAARQAGDVATESRLLAMIAGLDCDGGELARAELSAREAIQLVPEDATAGLYARAVLSDILTMDERWDEASACLEHILRSTDEAVIPHLTALFSLAHIRFRNGRIEEARALLESEIGKAREVTIQGAIDALAAAIFAKLGLVSKAERAAETAYARPSGTLETVIARTILIHYELERVRLVRSDTAARGRIETTLTMLGEIGERGRSWVDASADVRLTLAPLRVPLQEAGYRVPAERDDAPELVLVGTDEARLGERTFVLGHRHTLRQILFGLVDAPRGSELSVDGIFALGWPGERAAQRAARNRVHVALATLRRDLLGPWLRRSASGYSLDPTVKVVRLTDGSQSQTH